MADRATLRPTRAPASWQTRAMARSTGLYGSGGKYARRGTSGAVVAVLIECISAQEQARGPSGRGSRSRRRSRIRKWDEGMDTSSDVGRTARARSECGPACESSSAREAGVRSERCLLSARSSHAWTAVRCHPRRQSVGSSPRGRMGAHVWSGMASSHRLAASTEGMRPAAEKPGGLATGGRRRWGHAGGGMTGRVSIHIQEAQ